MRIFIAAIAILLIGASAGAETTINWWQFWTDPTTKPVIQQMIADFEQQNPDIKVNLTDLTWANGHEKIVLAFASGTAPDVVELGSDWIAQFASEGQLMDMTDLTAKDSADYQGWTMSTWKEKVYAFPWILGTRVLFGNRDLIMRTGRDSMFVPVTRDSLLKSAVDIMNLGEDYYGWGSNTAEKHRLYKKYLPFFWGSGGRIMSPDGRFCLIASIAGVKSLEYYKLLNDTAGYVDNQRGIEDAFLDGKIGYIMSGDWLLKRIQQENRKINLLSTLIPGVKFPSPSFMGGEFLAIGARSKNQEAAMKLVRFIASPENQIRFCKANLSSNPSSVAAQEDPFFKQSIHRQTFISALQTAKHPPVDPDWVFMEDIIERAVENALFGGEMPGQALLDARDAIEELKGLR